MNIVTATFSAGCTQIEADRKLWQYDQGQILQLVGLELPDTYQVEFSNSRDKGSAKAQIGGPDGVSIPDEYLTTGKPVYAFLVAHTGEEDRETEKLVVIYVNARSQPTDEPITPEQQNIVDQLIAALNAGVKKAEDAAEQAEAAISYMPKIVDGTWWVYDAETETWADTGIQAEGQDGVGISGAVLNADYTLTLTFTDGTSYTTPSIRGPKGEDAPDDYILVQPTEPTSETNALWINSAAGERVQLPTMADHQALAEDVAANTQGLADQKSAFEAHEQYAEETYAKRDGTYEDLTAGNAYELLSDRGDTNQQPYLFRQTGGDSSAYNREQLKKIVGGTVAFNQLSKHIPEEFTYAGVTVTPNDDGGVTLNGTKQSGGAITAFVNFAVFENHKYFIHPYGSAFGAGASVYTSIGGNTAGLDLIRASNSTITNATVTLRADAGVTFTNARAFITTIDLTQMFGTAIADYIYSLEQATAGAGVAFFRSLFPADYYDYNPGELMSVEGVSAHETVGFNQWDGTADSIGKSIAADGSLQTSSNYCVSDYIRVLPNTTYYLKNVAPSANARTVFCYGYDKSPITAVGLSGTQNVPASGLLTTVDGTHFVRIVRFASTAEYGINLSDPARNGAYEPYKKRTYPLDSSLILRGIPKLDSNNRLYYDGDTYKPDGTVERRYKEILINESRPWYKDSDTEYNRYYFQDDTIKRYLGYVGLIPNSKGYENANGYSFAGATNDIAVSLYNIGGGKNAGRNWFYIGFKLSMGISTVAALKTWLASNNFTVVVELATPTTETAEPYRELEICDRDGTEEFVSTSIVPVGHETFYPVNVFDYIDQKIAAAVAAMS